MQLFGFTVHSGIDYYLAYPEGHKSRRKVRLFREWILKEAKGG